MTTTRDALSQIPQAHLDPLLADYEAAMTDARRRDWDGVATKAGRVCEATYGILKGHVDGVYAGTPFKPSNMVAACTAMEQAHQARFPRTVRITLPRVILAVYEFRNNRAVHVGADVRPNSMDGEFLARSVQWIVAELVRVFSALPVEDAQTLVELVSERSLPLLWVHEETIRVLDPRLSFQDQVLLLLYHEAREVPVAELRRYVDWKGGTDDFRTEVIMPMHRQALIHRFPPVPVPGFLGFLLRLYDKQARIAILPPGIERVERVLLSGS